MRMIAKGLLIGLAICISPAVLGASDFEAGTVKQSDGKEFFVNSTTTPIGMKQITGSKVFMVESGDEGRTWSLPVRIELPYSYLVGKIHNGLKLPDGTLAMAFSWDLWAQKGTPARTEGEINLA